MSCWWERIAQEHKKRKIIKAKGKLWKCDNNFVSFVAHFGLKLNLNKVHAFDEKKI